MARYFGICKEIETDVWESVLDLEGVCSDEMVFSSKETYTYDNEEGLSFDYKFYVDCAHNYSTDKWVYIFGIYVAPNSLDRSVANAILNHTGCERAEQLNVLDVICFGGCDVPIAHETTDENFNYSVIDTAAEMIPMVNAMFDFLMKKPCSIGTSGFDVLEHAVNNKPFPDRLSCVE